MDGPSGLEPPTRGRNAAVRAVAVAAAAALFSISAASPVRARTPAACAPLRLAQQETLAHDDPPARTVTIGSLNLAAQPKIGQHVAAWTAQRGIDVLLLQEVGHSSIDGETFVAALGERLGFRSVYAPANILGGYTQGLAIMSRFPIEDVQVLPLAYHRLRFRSRCRIALGATLRTPGGPIRLMNIHLDTRINGKDRVAQLAPVLDALEGLDAPQLVGGDFNTMNARWVGTMLPLVYVERQPTVVRKFLAANGFDTPFHGTRATFKLMHLPIRLDWLYLKGLTPLDWNVDNVPLSDHRGIWAKAER